MRAQKALAAKFYGAVVEELKPFVSAHPEECELSLILGRAYLYGKHDHDAEKQFSNVLAREPSNRTAKLELARLYGYHDQYVRSNQLFTELLDADPTDESASIGLARNLIDTDNIAKAEAVLKAGLAAHPNSLRLQEYQDLLSAQQNEVEAPDRNWTYVIEDSAADSIVENLTRASAQLSPRFTAHITTRVRHLSSDGGIVEPPNDNAESEGGPTVSVVTSQATTHINYHITHWVSATAGGGAVRFNNGTSKGLFRAGLEAHRGTSLYLNVTYSRAPVLPTQEAETFHLTWQGWRTSFDWSPPQWRVHLLSSTTTYSDTNRLHEQDADALRWFGVGKVSLGTGITIDHLYFDQTLNHGYFSPTDYQSYMESTAVRLQHFHHYNAEFRFNSGAETIEPSPFRFIYEISTENFLRFGKWDLHADYTFDHATQSTGAFQTSFTRIGIKYTY
jgi:tetratricopeptide (TPR) repeat protein